MTRLGEGGGLGRGGFRKALKSKKVHAAVQKKAGAVREYWKSISPVFGDKPPHRSVPAHGAPGAYRDSIATADMTDFEGPRARVQAHDFKARWIEYGSSHMPTYAPKAKVLAEFK